MLSSAPRVATRPRFGVKMGGFESVFGNAGKEVYEQVMLGSGLIVITKASEDLLKGYLAQNPHKAGPLRARMRELEIPEDRIKAVFENFRPSSGGLLLSDDQRKALETLGLSPTAGLTIKDVARSVTATQALQMIRHAYKLYKKRAIYLSKFFPQQLANRKAWRRLVCCKCLSGFGQK